MQLCFADCPCSRLASLAGDSLAWDKTVLAMDEALGNQARLLDAPAEISLIKKVTGEHIVTLCCVHMLTNRDVVKQRA